MSINNYFDNAVIKHYLPKGEPRTMANQLAAAAESITLNWMNNGGTIWDTKTDPFTAHACQSCADWIYKYIYGAGVIINQLNQSDYAGRSELYTMVMDYEGEGDWSEDCEEYGFKPGEINVNHEQASIDNYEELLCDLLDVILNPDLMRVLSKIPAVGSIDDCHGPVYAVVTEYHD